MLGYSSVRLLRFQPGPVPFLGRLLSAASWEEERLCALKMKYACEDSELTDVYF